MAHHKWNEAYSRLVAFAMAITAVLGVLSLPFAAGGGGTVEVGANVIVGATCSFTVSNTQLLLGGTGGISEGQNTAGTVNVITVTNTGYNPSNILVYGSNPTFGTNSFYVENTIYSYGANSVFSPGTTPTLAGTGNVETRLTGSQVDSLIVVPGTGSSTNSIWFGQAVPTGTVGGTYAWTIDIVSSC